MSMHDRCWCACDCPQADCERNTKLNEDFKKYKYHEWITVSYLDEDNPDKTHSACEYKLKRED